MNDEEMTWDAWVWLAAIIVCSAGLFISGLWLLWLAVGGGRS